MLIVPRMQNIKEEKATLSQSMHRQSEVWQCRERYSTSTSVFTFIYPLILGPLSCLARQDSAESQHHRRFAGDSAVRLHKRLLPHRDDRHGATGCRCRGSSELILNGWTCGWVDGWVDGYRLIQMLALANVYYFTPKRLSQTCSMTTPWR